MVTQAPAKLDLSGFDYEGLKAVREDINAKLKEMEREAISTLEHQALKFGFQLAKIGLGLKGRSKLKFVNPDDPSQTYGGRGKKPAWLAEKLEQGASLEDFKA